MRKLEGSSGEYVIRYLEMIQGVITRMGTNSFALKGWTVTLGAGILALSSALTDKIYTLIALVPILAFWFLDTYYLQMGRQYRALFNYIRISENAPIDFDLELKKDAVWMQNEDTLHYWNCFWSNSEKWFYLPIGVIVLVLLISIEATMHGK